MNDYFVAAIWIAMALAASLISIRIGVSVALVEILVGALLGNIPGVRTYVERTSFTAFLATLGSVLLTFLAGAEIDPVSLRRSPTAPSFAAQTGWRCQIPSWTWMSSSATRPWASR